MNPARPLMNSGAILAGRWQIQDFIGSGETGEVYGVHDLHGANTFALKLFWPNALGQPEIWSAVQQTARTASGLGVEGVARAHDFGIDANSGRPFLLAERVSWSSLADRVRLRGPLTPAQVATALQVLARALDAAHAIGIVHRDLKPENVFISPDNPSWVRITDFGVALLRAASPPPPGWGGTVGWVGPDAADPNARSTPAMDVFALGLVTFFALTGNVLHRAARAAVIDPDALWRELTTPLDSCSARAREFGAALDPAFDGWFERATHPNPLARFSSVSELSSSFEAIARTLFAPQSQNAVAIQGVAAAIAQPLIFQPEPSHFGASADAQSASGSAESSAALGAAAALRASDPPVSSIPGVKKRSAAALFIAGAIVCLSLTAFGAYALLHQRGAVDAPVAEAAGSVTAAMPSAARAEPSLSPPSPAASAALPAASSATASAEPSSLEPVRGAAAASASGAANAPRSAQPAAALAAKPANQPAAVAATSGTANSQRTVAVKSGATAVSNPKSAAAVAAAARKKKCGSVFIPCK